jgi:hypothetical protein
MDAAAQISSKAIRNCRIGFILASAFFTARAYADDPPADLMRRIVQRETETQQAQSNYTYQQTVTIDEFDQRGARSGEYKEVRDVIFSPAHERTEQFLGKPQSSLTRLKLTDEDFRDLREIQPFVLTKDQAFIYETKFRGDETMDGRDCWVLQIRPRQILQGQRLFDGMIWVDKQDFSVIRNEGQAVPQILTTKTENLFPRFTTIRRKVDGDFWFPVKTYGDDQLQFRTGPLHMRLVIDYDKYQKFGADSKITFEK